nr:hypothetical protein [uncultured Massilia sp.]
MLIFRIAASFSKIFYSKNVTWTKTWGKSYEGMSTDELKAFFREPENFRDLCELDIADIIGPWERADEWGDGRALYEWVRPDCILRLSYESEKLVMVEFCNPDVEDRTGARQIMWERPSR